MEGASETPLTRALRRLGERGLIRQGMTLDDPGDPRYYAAIRRAGRLEENKKRDRHLHIG